MESEIMQFALQFCCFPPNNNNFDNNKDMVILVLQVPLCILDEGYEGCTMLS